MKTVRQLGVFRNPLISPLISPLIPRAFQLAIRVIGTYRCDPLLHWLLREKLNYVRRQHGVGVDR